MTPCSCEVKTCGCKNVGKINEETRKSKRPTRKRKYKRPVAKPKRKFDKLFSCLDIRAKRYNSTGFDNKLLTAICIHSKTQ